MRQATKNPLSHRERLTRGLAHTAVGPVDVALGAVGLGGAAVRRGAVELRRGTVELGRRYRESRLSDRVAEAAEAAARDLTAAQEMVAGLPELFDRAPARRRVRRSWLIAGAVGTVLLAGGVVAVLVRRSGGPAEPSPRPPSVDAPPQV
ncbi:cell wall synthesis protein CwsA [Mycolicibacter minnesotensis]